MPYIWRPFRYQKEAATGACRT